MFHVPERFRLCGDGPLCSDSSYGYHGAFMIPYDLSRVTMKCIASDGLGWEHVSVALVKRCPSWEEMCFVKGLFWDDDDLVVQYHPPKSEYDDRDCVTCYGHQYVTPLCLRCGETIASVHGKPFCQRCNDWPEAAKESDND
jgi:hypothetical protein